MECKYLSSDTATVALTVLSPAKEWGLGKNQGAQASALTCWQLKCPCVSATAHLHPCMPAWDIHGEKHPIFVG